MEVAAHPQPQAQESVCVLCDLSWFTFHLAFLSVVCTSVRTATRNSGGGSSGACRVCEEGARARERAGLTAHGVGGDVCPPNHARACA